MNYEGLNLEYEDFTNADLTGAIFTHSILAGANLAGANLTSADLTGADLTGANLEGATLTGANLEGATLTGAVLTGVKSGSITGTASAMADNYTITEGYIVGPGADLEGATLAGADLTGVILTGVILTDADLSYADLTGVDLTDTTLTGADLTGATLTGATLTYANLTGVTLTGADLTNSNGITQADVDAAYNNGVASVTPDDGITQADVDAAYAAGLAVQAEQNEILLNQIQTMLANGHVIPSTQSCFRKDTLLKTDQGTIKIQNVVAGYHTINNKEIKCVTAVYNSDGMIVKIEKDCLGENKPSNTIYMQKDHKLMISPFEFSALLTSGKIQLEKSSSDEILYNILLDNHETMMIENIQVETLDPKLEISKYFMGTRSEEHKALIESNTPKMVFC